MLSRKSTTLPVRIAVAGACLLLLAACSPGVPQSEYDVLKQQLSTQEKKVAALQQQISAQAQAPKPTEAPQKPTDAPATQAPAKGAPSGVTVLIGAVVETPPPPKPTPTPLPAGAPTLTPAPAPVLPASYKTPVPVYIYADTVIGSGSTLNVGPTSDGPKSSCVITGIFKRGMRIVWRFEAIDTSTGKRLTDADVESAVVHLPHGEDLKARFSRHGATESSPWFWAAAWDIPLNYPLGTLDWRVDVKTKDGKVGTFRQIQVFSDTTDSRTQIIG